MQIRPVGDLPPVNEILATDKFVLEQRDGSARCLPGQVLLNLTKEANPILLIVGNTSDGSGGFPILGWMDGEEAHMNGTPEAALAACFKAYQQGRAVFSQIKDAVDVLLLPCTYCTEQDAVFSFWTTNGRSELLYYACAYANSGLVYEGKIERSLDMGKNGNTLVVTVDKYEKTASHTAGEIYEAFQAGNTVLVYDGSKQYILFAVSPSLVVAERFTITTTGSVQRNIYQITADAEAIWETFTANQVFVTGATKGQTVRIKSVDADGKPTSWEAVDFPSGDSGGQDGFSPIATVTQTASGAVVSITDKKGTTTATIANGKDGAVGPKGDKGDTPVKGADYFTDADKAEMVSEVLALVPGDGGGSSGSEIVTTLGNTPQKLTKSGVVRLVCASECAYSVTSDTVAVFDVLSGETTKTTAAKEDGYYKIQADGTATAWYQQYVTISLPDVLTVGEKYNFVFDAAGVNGETSNYGIGHWILHDSGGTTLLTREATHGAIKHVREFTATTAGLKLVWYPNANKTFVSGETIAAYVKAIYINRAGTSNLTGVVELEGSFTGSATLGTIPAGATISATPAAMVYLVTGANSDDNAKKALADKTVVCFGDSLFGMYRGDDSAPAIVAEYTGATVHNVGFGGCRMSVHPSNGFAAFSMWALAKAIAEDDWTTQDAQASSGSDYFPEHLALLKSIDFNDVDMVVIHYGTNDFAAGGGTTIDNASDPDDYTTLCGALRYSVEKLLGAYPKLQIYVSLPVYRFWTESGNTTYAETYTRYNHTLPDFVEALRNTASEYNLPVIDGFHGMGVNKHNASAYLSDGTHHNVAGRKLFGEYIGGHLISRQATGKSGVDTAAVNALISAAIGGAIGGSY